MVEVSNWTSDIATPNARKRKGFWSKSTSNFFGRSSDAKEDKDEKEPEPKRKGLMNSLMASGRQAATKEVTHLAEHEATKLVDEQFDDDDNDNGSQTNVNAQNGSDASPAATNVTLNGVFSAPVNWAKKMVNNAQQKVQSLPEALAS